MNCYLNCWEYIENLQPGSCGEVADGPGASAGEGPTLTGIPRIVN
jgi:hypothetical protein